jgi:phenylacetate-coenzyme A ligase PaaK-like adenylate-forming protein
MKILDDFIRYILTRRMSQIDYFRRHPEEVQEKTLRYLLKTAQNTEWGKKFHYKEIKNYQDFQHQVPVSAYEDLSSLVERMMKGEQNILWPTPIHWFSKSSGTTNARSKFIPVSREALKNCHIRGGRDVLALFIDNQPKSRFFWGRGLSIGGTFQKIPDNPQAYFGDISAVVVQNLPQWAQNLRTPPLSIAMMDKWEEKIEAMAKHTIPLNITSLLGVPTWTVVLLQRILEITGKQYIHEVWPNLEVFVHGAVAFTPYKSLFKSIAPKLLYLETYNASEGFFGLQDDISRDDMLLMLDYEVFYEFIPINEVDKPNPKVLTLSEIELEKNYAMLISTSGGLWRYKIGDTVKFTSKNPYRIKITGRTKQFINAFGEEVIVENAEEALAFACNQTEALVSNFTAGPLYMHDNQSGGHEWIIEFEKAPLDLQLFTRLLDQKLREVNSDYDAKRYQDIALRLPLIHHVPNGTFYNWLKKRNKLGGQNKVPRLANSREYLEDILASMAEIN